MKIPKVVNVREEPYDVYIGRPSKWGNPFKGSRKEVIEKYENYIRSRPELLDCLPELYGKTLGCWCKPKACHGDVLVKLVQEKINQEKIEQMFKGGSYETEICNSQ